MRVRYGNHVLAAGGSEAPDGLRLTHNRAAQTADYIAADQGETFSRGNARRELSFTVTRTHDHLRAATAFILDHPENLADSGTLLVEQRETAGVVRRWSSEAVLLRADLVQQIGITTIWLYQFALGPITKADPDIIPTSA